MRYRRRTADTSDTSYKFDVHMWYANEFAHPAQSNELNRVGKCRSIMTFLYVAREAKLDALFLVPRVARPRVTQESTGCGLVLLQG